MTLSYLMAAPVLWIVSVVEYILLNRGYTLRSVARTAFAYAVAAVAAVLPMAIAGHAPDTRPLIFAAISAGLFQLAYPLLYRLSHRSAGQRYGHAADTVVGLCMFGVLSALLLIGGPCAWIVGPVELAMLATVLVQATYFVMYGSGMDAYGFRLMTQTNTNEVIEFIRYYPWWATAAVSAALMGILCASVAVNLPAHPMPAASESLCVAAAAAVCVAVMCIRGRNSALARSGFVSFYLAKRDNTHRLLIYRTHRADRERGINARLLGKPYDGPSTIVLVVGESSNRDYMSAFVPSLERDTTPWLSACLRDDPQHWAISPNAYSCGMHTFVALEQGFTEQNQFNAADFVTAASIVDMARAAGRRVHWYSNQGHLGASLSQVSVVAEESDEALWTEQRPGLPPYDMELLPFLDRVDPTRDNLVVLHLKGNHFSFENRYPADAETWRPNGPDDTRTTYMNSIHYVDEFLRRVWTIASERLNLKAMVYCSDHAIIPDKHRGPTFAGFGDVRIPLAVYTSDDFIASHPERHAALRTNRNRYWTNDFLFDLMCGLLDIDSPKFNPANSLAHSSYRYTRDDLTILNGTVPISSDDGVPHSL